MTPSLKHLISRAHPGSIFGLAYFFFTRGVTHAGNRCKGLFGIQLGGPITRAYPGQVNLELCRPRSLGHAASPCCCEMLSW